MSLHVEVTPPPPGYEPYLMTVGKSSAPYTYTASNEMNIKNLANIAMMIRPAMKPADNNDEISVVASYCLSYHRMDKRHVKTFVGLEMEASVNLTVFQ